MKKIFSIIRWAMYLAFAAALCMRAIRPDQWAYWVFAAVLLSICALILDEDEEEQKN